MPDYDQRRAPDPSNEADVGQEEGAPPSRSADSVYNALRDMQAQRRREACFIGNKLPNVWGDESPAGSKKVGIQLVPGGAIDGECGPVETMPKKIDPRYYVDPKEQA